MPRVLYANCAGGAECRDRSDDTLAMCADTQRLQMSSVVGIRHVAHTLCDGLMVIHSVMVSWSYTL